MSTGALWTGEMPQDWPNDEGERIVLEINIHHPDRLARRDRRIGPKTINWEDEARIFVPGKTSETMTDVKPGEALGK